jgi:Flp pilus assembly protein TadD
LKLRGRDREALIHFAETVRLTPDDASALRSLAWILATSPDNEVRDAIHAIQHAERAVATTNRRHADALDALAAAYASAGEFVRALDTINEAIAVDPGPRATEMRMRRDLYQRQQPYRELSEPAADIR